MQHHHITNSIHPNCLSQKCLKIPFNISILKFIIITITMLKYRMYFQSPQQVKKEPKFKIKKDLKYLSKTNFYQNDNI